MPYYKTAFVQKSKTKVVACFNLVMDKTTYLSEVL